MPIVSGGGAAGGLPSPWTSDSHGAVVAETNAQASIPLKIQANAQQTPADFAEIFSVQGTSTELLYFDSAGELQVIFDGSGGGQCFIKAAGSKGTYWQGDSLLFNQYKAAPADASITTSGFAFWLDDTIGASKLNVKAKDSAGTVVAPGLTGRDIATAPAVSAASTLALGTAYQNTLGYDVMLCVYLSVTVNTSGVLKLGVGPTATPTQQTLVTGITSTGLWPVPIYLPSTYYALLSVTGTITVAVDGQIAMPV